MSVTVEALQEEATTDCVAYTEFMLQYKKGRDYLYCFFEGYEDPTYYAIRVDNVARTEKNHGYICGGKDDVLKVRDLIKQHSYYKTVKTGFFVDKDFDNLTYPVDVYVTPTYSVENLYCVTDSLEKILTTEFRIKNNDSDLAECIGKYLELQNEFNQKTLLFNSWLACQADYRIANGAHVRLNIDKKAKGHFDNIVLPDISGIKNFDDFSTKERIEAIYTEAVIIDNGTLFKKVAEFDSHGQSYFFRGKFQIRFLTSFLSRIQAILGRDNPIWLKKYSCSLRFEHSTICSALSQYAQTPQCLKDYIFLVSK
jgi:hypothetical protein